MTYYNEVPREFSKSIFGNIEKIRSLLDLLDAKAQLRIKVLFSLQVVLSFLEIFGVILLGALIASVTSVNSLEEFPRFIQSTFDLFNVKDLEKDRLYLTSLIFVLFLAKNSLSLLLSWYTFDFLSRQQMILARKNVKKLLDVDFAVIKKHDPEFVAYSINDGVDAILIGVLANSIIFSTEVVLLILIFFGLIVLSPTLGIISILYFLIVAVFLNSILSKQIQRNAELYSNAHLEYRTEMSSILKVFREIRIYGKGEFFANRLNLIRLKSVNIIARNNWISLLPKSILEITMLSGILGLLIFSKQSSNPAENLTTVGVFLSAATRIIPSLLRLQASIFIIRNSIPAAKRGIGFLRILDAGLPLESTIRRDVNLESTTSKSQTDELVEFEKVSFTYLDGSNRIVLDSISIKFALGERVLLTGPSGSGKSTFADLLTGLILPSEGQVTIDGIASRDWIEINFGKIAYLSQDTKLLTGSLKENICIGVPPEEINQDDLKEAIKISQFGAVLERFPKGLATQVSEGNPQLSGGERQRLGIARTLYSQPKIIIMDEATSSLDGELERGFLKALESFPRSTLIIYVAHRLNAISHFTRIIYLENGSLVADGSLEQVLEKSNNFQKQYLSFKNM
jgi:ABC-type multidrug transport system fused ATPase/permease subunit